MRWNKSSGTYPIALAADVRGFRLRRRVGRDDQVARAHGRRLR